MKILLIDNYDSFTFNLYHYLSSLKVHVDVIRNDQISSKEILKRINNDGKLIAFDRDKSAIKNKIDEFAKYIDKSQKANFERWDILGVYVWPNPVYDLTYEQEVNRLENWIEERMNWLNSNF